MTSVTDLCLDRHFPTQGDLINAFLPEIEEAAKAHVPEDHFLAFFYASLRIAAKAENFTGLNLKALVYHTGYSRSTFYRLFDGYSAFMMNVYQLTRLLGVKVYAKHLTAREMTLEEFADFSANLMYSANAALPPDLCKMLWDGREVDHLEFHPHLPEAASVITTYLNTNPQTSHMTVRQEDIFELLRMLDWDMLQAFATADPKCPSQPHYRHIKRLFRGYLFQLAAQSAPEAP